MLERFKTEVAIPQKQINLLRPVKLSLHHVIWGPGNIEKRIFDGCHDPQWKLPHVKTSSLGEIVGWARPDEFPPRNMRTSKALRALGNPVRVNI